MSHIYNTISQTYKLSLIREPPQTLSGHLRILSVIETGDAGLAEEYIRNHFNKSIEKIN